MKPYGALKICIPEGKLKEAFYHVMRLLLLDTEERTKCYTNSRGRFLYFLQSTAILWWKPCLDSPEVQSQEGSVLDKKGAITAKNACVPGLWLSHRRSVLHSWWKAPSVAIQVGQANSGNEVEYDGKKILINKKLNLLLNLTVPRWVHDPGCPEISMYTQ